MEYKKIPTTPEVWAVIRASHRELVVFSTYSAPDGEPHGNPDKCRMMTEYGFKDFEFPTIGAETTWNKDPECSWGKLSEKHNYWLCVAVHDEE